MNALDKNLQSPASPEGLPDRLMFYILSDDLDRSVYDLLNGLEDLFPEQFDFRQESGVAKLYIIKFEPDSLECRNKIREGLQALGVNYDFKKSALYFQGVDLERQAENVADRARELMEAGAIDPEKLNDWLTRNSINSEE